VEKLLEWRSQRDKVQQEQLSRSQLRLRKTATPKQDMVKEDHLRRRHKERQSATYKRYLGPFQKQMETQSELLNSSRFSERTIDSLPSTPRAFHPDAKHSRNKFFDFDSPPGRRNICTKLDFTSPNYHDTHPSTPLQDSNQKYGNRHFDFETPITRSFRNSPPHDDSFFVSSPAGSDSFFANEAALSLADLELETSVENTQVDASSIIEIQPEITSTPADEGLQQEPVSEIEPVIQEEAKSEKKASAVVSATESFLRVLISVLLILAWLGAVEYGNSLEVQMKENVELSIQKVLTDYDEVSAFKTRLGQKVKYMFDTANNKLEFYAEELIRNSTEMQSKAEKFKMHVIESNLVVTEEVYQSIESTARNNKEKMIQKTNYNLHEYGFSRSDIANLENYVEDKEDELRGLLETLQFYIDAENISSNTHCNELDPTCSIASNSDQRSLEQYTEEPPFQDEQVLADVIIDNAKSVHKESNGAIVNSAVKRNMKNADESRNDKEDGHTDHSPYFWILIVLSEIIIVAGIYHALIRRNQVTGSSVSSLEKDVEYFPQRNQTKKEAEESVDSDDGSDESNNQGDSDVIFFARSATHISSTDVKNGLIYYICQILTNYIVVIYRAMQVLSLLKMEICLHLKRSVI